MSSALAILILKILTCAAFYLRHVQVIPLHAIKSTKDKKELIVEYDWLVESSRRWCDIEGDSPRPAMRIKVELMNVIESCEGKIDASKDIHRVLSGTGCVPVSTLNISFDIFRP